MTDDVLGMALPRGVLPGGGLDHANLVLPHEPLELVPPSHPFGRLGLGEGDAVDTSHRTEIVELLHILLEKYTVRFHYAIF